MTTERADVVVVGDGPAGTALAAACAARDLDHVLVGPDAPWPATYATWLDDLEGVSGLAALDRTVAAHSPSVSVYAPDRILLERPYGILDNDRLRARLRRDVRHVTGTAKQVDTADPPRVDIGGGRSIAGRVVIDASGAGRLAAPAPAAAAWQTAFGTVLPEPPEGELGAPTLMDFRAVPAATGAGGWPGQFCYALPHPAGWIVEETVLAARPAVAAELLAEPLAARLGRTPDELTAAAVATELVRIPMGGPLPARDGIPVPFGAAAGYVHPATGYSVAASLRTAGRVADRIGEVVAAPGPSGDRAAAAVRDAVWPRRLRRTRALHDYGLEVMLRLDPAALTDFFATFFSLPLPTWSAYLRFDAGPGEVMRTMSSLFLAADRPLRRRLLAADPRGVARALHPRP